MHPYAAVWLPASICSHNTTAPALQCRSSPACRLEECPVDMACHGSLTLPRASGPTGIVTIFKSDNIMPGLQQARKTRTSGRSGLY